MAMNDEQDRHLELTVARIDFNVTAMKEELLGSPGRVGRIPRIEDTIVAHGRQDDEKFGKIDGQINIWRGALALLGATIAILGGVLLAHIIGGK